MSFSLEPLDINSILALIKFKNQQYLNKLEIFDILPSTNTYLLECVKKNSLSCHVVVADQQTQGRGRRGKVWFSPPGANIYCSLLWHFTDLQGELSGLGIAVAAIVADVLCLYGIEQGIKLKWPNDILFSGKKLGGILLETNSLNKIVIGVGLNLHLSSEQAESIQANVTSIDRILPHLPERNKLIGLLINELIEQLPLFEKRGLSDFVQNWRKYDAYSGKRITVYASDKVISGTMLGINEQGELLLEDDNQVVQCFRSGEVSVREGILLK